MYQNSTHKRSITLLLCLMASFLGYSQENEKLPVSPAAARQMAIGNLNQTLQWVTPEYLEQYGFNEGEELSAITVGIPLYQTSFYPDAVLHADGRKERSHDMILLPLELDGVVRCFLYIMPDEHGNFGVAGIGGAREAATWSPVIKQADKQYDHLTLLHLVQNNADYLLQPGTDKYDNISVGDYRYGQQEGHKSIDELYTEAVRIAKDARAVNGDMSN